jgi:hypothetical protein
MSHDKFAMSNKKPYTIWVWAPFIEERGTHYVTRIEASSPKEASAVAIEECHEEWGECYDTDDLRVLGIAEGDVTIIEWNENPRE